ncbi:MAG: hypothetical protein Q8936_23610 [Bacillota bacterium]|nr:hypothetical protein [Bacillota bacterium]
MNLSNGTIALSGGELDVKGDVIVSGGSIDLSHGELDTNGSVIQTGGTVNIVVDVYGY